MANANALVVAPADPAKRTTVTIPYAKDAWPVILAWAQAHQYLPREDVGGGKLFQKGSGIFVAPMMLLAGVDGGVVTLQAWVRGTFFARLMSLFILPAELNVGPGMRAVLPRRMARKAVNELIAQLGGTPIA